MNIYNINFLGSCWLDAMISFHYMKWDWKYLRSCRIIANKIIFPFLWLIYSVVFTILTVHWAFWILEISDELKGAQSGDIALDFSNVIVYLLWFLWLIAVIWWMKWWFQVLTAGWDEEKVKNWKKTVLFMMLWIFVILIAWALVSGVLGWLKDI